MNPRKHAPAVAARGYRYARYRRRLAAAVVLSLLAHAFLLSLQFGLPGLGLPGVELPWHQRRAQPAGLSVLLSGARRAPEITDKAETPMAESALAPPGESRPAPAAMPQESPARMGLHLAPAAHRPSTPATVPDHRLKRERRHDAVPALRKRKKESPATAGRRILTQDDMGQATFAVPLPVFEDSGQAATPAPSAPPELVPPAPPDMLADADDAALAEQERVHAAQQQAEEAAAQQARAAAARAEEERRLAQESEARRLAEAAEDQARQQREEEQARQALEREAKRLEALREERRQAEEAARRQAAALALQQAEQLRLEQENAARRVQEEVQRREVLRLQEEQARRAALELEARRQAEQAALRRRQEEEQAARQRAEAEARRQEELAAERQREQAAAERSRAAQAADALNGATGGSLAARALAQARKADDSAGLAPLPQPPMPSAEPARRRSVFGRIDNDVGLMMYVESWRLKIERNGRLNYRQSLVDSAYTEPVVTVALRSDGSVEEIIFHRSSGRPELDEAVRRIVRINARYAAFPPELARRFDVIEIRRVWTFDGALRLLEETR